jgi:hypothetical protein
MKHSVGITLPAGTATTVFTVPKGYVAEVDMLFISNHSGNNKTVSAYWQHEHDPTHQIYIIDAYPLATKGFVQFSGGSIIMQQGDSLVVTPEATSDMSVIVTFDLRKETQILTFNDE